MRIKTFNCYSCVTHRNPQFLGMVCYGTYHIDGI
ncbi:hypothetical protein SPLC1_S532020 [Arthrospira platensis C1]|nr:hypothetical protein SPLC1_S532020 [Arthrospira platensis C1]